MRLKLSVMYSSSIIRIFTLPVTALLLLFPADLTAGTKLTLLLTSNLQGRFSTTVENQDDSDPMLLLAQSIIKEREKTPSALFLDLGNSFYPGPVSRFSYGSVMMDFLSYFKCAATVVSSRDISAGLTNLEFLSKGRETKMLSSNITTDNKPVFTPHIIITSSGKKAGFIGVTSSEGLFDIADKKVLNISFSEYRESIKSSIEKLKAEGCTSFILLSGLSYRNNLDLMQDLSEISLIISGGDSNGSMMGYPVSKLDLPSGKSIVALPQTEGYCRLELDLDENVSIISMNIMKAEKYKTSDPSYLEFTGRLALWKNKFASEEKRIIAENLPAASVSDEAVANMLRYRYRCEIAILEKYSILPREITGTVYSSTLMDLVNNDYPVFSYRITGSDLKKIIENSSDLVITGIYQGRIQDFAISDSRTYSVCSTQIAYDRITRLVRHHIKYKNTWTTLQDNIESDLKAEKSLTLKSFDSLDDRFRMIIDISLSNFYDKSEVKRGDTISTPPGKPVKTYRRWGFEDTVNINIYNRYHQLLLTPYIYFIKLDDQYLQNLFRGTLLYTYNMNMYLKPYHKSQLDTVLVEEDDATGRPMLSRETIGASLATERISGKIGAGFEKQIHDPTNPSLYGIETIADANFPITDEIKYIFKIDSFISAKRRALDELNARIEITNTLSYKINTLLGVSVKYKVFAFYSKDIEESYRYSQMLLSLDLKTDYKFF